MAMAKFDVDTTNRLFIAKAGVTEFDVKIDLYSDMKEHWIANTDGSMGFAFPLIPIGGQDIVAGTSAIPLYAFFRGGWRIRPQEADHTLNVLAGILLVDGGGDPFVDTLGAFTVRINYQQPVQSIESTSAGPAAFIAALNATLYDGVPWEIVVQYMMAMANAKMVRTDLGSGLYRFDFYERDDTTILYSFTLDEDQRLRL
jgi:hypothetical protein